VRRTKAQVAADRHAQTVATALGVSLRGARSGNGATQLQVADAAGLAVSTVSEAERGNGFNFTLTTWSRLALASGSRLRVDLERATAADQPRDAAHLRVQQLLLDVSRRGRWNGAPELAIDDAARGSRFLDVALERSAVGSRPEAIVIEVVDWLDDVGSALRDWQGRRARLDRLATARLMRDDPDTAQPILPRVGGCWVLRATRRNRQLVADHQLVFRTTFPGSATGWLRALTTPAPIPEHAALLWVSVDGRRLWASRWTRYAS
jgi:transcriptional regulator with XRE-family HTH domain